MPARRNMGTPLVERLRLTPEGLTLADMKRQTRAALARGERYFMLTYHSSTLLPGVTPYAGHGRTRLLPRRVPVSILAMSRTPIPGMWCLRMEISSAVRLPSSMIRTRPCPMR